MKCCESKLRRELHLPNFPDTFKIDVYSGGSLRGENNITTGFNICRSLLNYNSIHVGFDTTVG